MAKQHAEAEADVAAAAAALLTSLPLALALPQCVCAVLPLLVMLRRISARFTFCVVPSTAADVAS